MYTGIVEVEVFTKKIRETLFYKKITAVEVREENINIEKDIFESALMGQMFIYINRRSDIINLTTGNAVNFMVRLGFGGGAYFAEKGEDFTEPYVLALTFLDGQRFFITGDANTKIEIVAEEERKPYYETLKVDPLDKDFTMDALNKLVMNFDGTVQDALSSGQEIAGIDPGYAADILLAAEIDPTREAGSLNMKEANNLFVAIQTVIQGALALDGKITRPYSKKDKRVGKYVLKSSLN